ncbi:ABC transporter ATP-binding protein [Egibacter rhizosphaerae]|uniref:ABC transporter ATP-binding protein n=1 Tax=Egibacter rhizosphaerae TaxID=1670831 RepID=A0A411YKC9_9ACTN|nr:ABC transporter ATP-binding protein [Egibacter rhizosphaerae]QBI21668.1 ABC transporter ATP-binding protein [Egibacter rhizosphaerae]
MLAVSNLEVVYDDVIQVLRGVSLEVPEGSIIALLGSNGAGKTTLLRALSGLLDVHEGEITKGRITLDGQPIHRKRPEQLVGLGIKQVLEGRRIFAEFSVEENLRIGAYVSNRGMRDAMQRVFDLFPILADRRRATAGYLSGGEQQMLAMGRALMSSPRYLLLDEPSLGLAPRLVEQIRDLIVQIRDQGTTVLLVEQNANMALSIAEHGYILETGKIVMDKPAVELIEDEDVREFYLGMADDESQKSFRDVKHYKRRKRWLS